jgi:hypothetical protein
VTTADTLARLRASGDHEAADAIERLQGIIRRNRVSFDGLRSERNAWRERALKAEARTGTGSVFDAIFGGGR